MSEISNSNALPGMVGNSAAMQEVYRLTRLAAISNSSVLLLGEIGTGKDLVALAIHQLSGRSAGPLVRVHCGSLTDSFLDRELFGQQDHLGAAVGPVGKFQSAHRGTLFLDEINATSETLQVKLLEMLQSQSDLTDQPNQFDTNGETLGSPDVRVIAACNRDLEKEIHEGLFREDLYWCLNVIPIRLAPLRRRKEDIEPLVLHFLTQFCRANGRELLKIHPQALDALQKYSWPGNVRELKNYVERAVVLAQGQLLTAELLPQPVVGSTEDAQSAVFRPTDDKELIREYVYSLISKSDPKSTDLHDQIVKPVEKELLAQIMESCNDVQIKAASRLGMNRNTLRTKLRDHGLDKAEKAVKVETAD